MDGFLRKHSVRLTGLAVALIALASLLTFHPQDPTFTNLRYPKDGVANWAGYPGALLGGSAVEGFGWAALWLPLLIANFMLFSRNRPAWHRYILHGLALMLVVAAAAGMGPNLPTLGLRGPGLVGWTAGQWMLATLGIWPSAIALAFAGLYSLTQVAYAPQFRRIFVDARTLSRFGVKRLWAQAIAKWQQTRPQTGWAWHELLLLPLHGGLFATGWLWERGISRPLISPMGAAVQGFRERRYSVARVKSSQAAPTLRTPSVAPNEPPGPRPQIQTPVPDAFADWMDTPEIVSPITLPPAAPSTPAAPVVRPIAASLRPAMTPPPSSAPMPPLPTDAPGADRGGDRVARWEEYLRRYKENLDLDWDERSWKRKRLEELAEDGDEDKGAAAPPNPK